MDVTHNTVFNLNLKRNIIRWFMMLILILCVVIPTIIANVEIGNQECGDPMCSGILLAISIDKIVLRLRRPPPP